ncbi:phage tail P2-like protein [Sedimentibacter acidaminivorans]|uniref:Phage tail P2-like protein n=1 Tax=Sedimentibacter acidaminivorans TaxID=913099 RepID=A0ABS4GA77_9FIRM|nr:phage tail protein I [Sedimentibacter acidaminivorans]MBP1924584.1 phage tail P2-like protein [Sedimentibacter acidaminivorans]
MSRTIHDVNLLELLPENLRQDPDIIAASKAVDLGFLALANEADNVIIIPRVDDVSDELLDHLAYYFHVDFYDLALDTETKRSLVKDSVYMHQIKGTPLAVKTLITTLFGEGEVSEWFDYEDTPYRFRIITSNESVTTDRAAEFIRALDTVKNVRSTLDRVILLQSEKMNLYWGGIVQGGNYEIYR